MVHPAALAISFGIALGGAIFALFYLRQQEHEQSRNLHRYPDFEIPHANHFEADTCSICLDRFDNDNDNVIDLICLHRFHDRCIQEALRHSPNCPNCRQMARIRRID